MTITKGHMLQIGIRATLRKKKEPETDCQDNERPWNKKKKR